jgi:hypothetical protein
MDPLFNRLFLPKNPKPHQHLIYPQGKTFVTGLASSFSSEGYDPGFFTGRDLSEGTYRDLIDRVNTVLFTYWPCTFCQLLGYCLCPCTLGLSFYCCPGLAIREARQYLLEEIEDINCNIL